MKRSPLRSIGRHAKKKRPLRAAVVERVLARDGEMCQAIVHYLNGNTTIPRFVIVECRLPLDVHEIIPRSVWPDGELVEDNCVTVCRAHHEWIDSYLDDAEKIGLHGRSWDRP